MTALAESLRGQLGLSRGRSGVLRKVDQQDAVQVLSLHEIAQEVTALGYTESVDASHMSVTWAEDLVGSNP